MHISPYVSCGNIGHVVLLKSFLIGRIMPLKNLLLSTSIVNVLNDLPCGQPAAWWNEKGGPSMHLLPGKHLPISCVILM